MVIKMVLCKISKYSNFKIQIVHSALVKCVGSVLFTTDTFAFSLEFAVTALPPLGVTVTSAVPELTKLKS